MQAGRGKVRSRGRIQGLAGLIFALIAALEGWFPAFLIADARAATSVEAERALIYEAKSHAVLFTKAATDAFEPGNFAKLMTLAVVFDALKAGEITPETILTVTPEAWKIGGAPAKVSAMFVKKGEKVAVRDLLRGVMIAYGNEAAITLAEGVAGTETAFAQRMNKLAKKLGMVDSRFANATGFDNSLNRITLNDLQKLITYLQDEHPEAYKGFAEAEITWNKVRQLNKTAPIRSFPGVDGLMLTQTKASGFGAAISLQRDGSRFILLSSGAKTAATRDKVVKTLVEASANAFETVELYQAGATVADLRVFGGTHGSVAVTGQGAIAITLPRGDRKDFRARVAYTGPLPAPIRKGDKIAILEIRNGDHLYQEVPLYAAEDVAKGELMSRARDGAMELLFGWW